MPGIAVFHLSPIMCFGKSWNRSALGKLAETNVRDSRRSDSGSYDTDGLSGLFSRVCEGVLEPALQDTSADPYVPYSYLHRFGARKNFAAMELLSRRFFNIGNVH
jgi:hypothetical protein